MPFAYQFVPSALTFKVPVPPPEAVTVTFVEDEAVVAVEKVRFVGAAGAAEARVTVKVSVVSTKVDPSPPVLVGLLTKIYMLKNCPLKAGN